jgi:thiol:disulfide interchange protein
MNIAIVVAVLSGWPAAEPEPAKSVEFFQGTFEEALGKAGQKKVPVFIDFYTDWCGWCKVLDAKVYTDPAVRDLFEKRFVAMKLNAEDKGEGTDLAKKFKVRGYPTAVIVDPASKGEVDRIVGFSPADQYAKRLREIADGKDTFLSLKKRVEASPDDLDAWSLYALKLEERDSLDDAETAW